LFITPWLAETFLRARRFRALTANAPTLDDAERWVHDLSRPGRLTAALDWYRANLTRQAVRFHLPAVQVPTLGVYSTADVALAEDQMTGSAAYVDAPWRYARLDGVGHWLQIEAAEDVNGLLKGWFDDGPQPVRRPAGRDPRRDLRARP
jgi:pimeloyl-ACP methyl ester carboxylesterase